MGLVNSIRRNFKLMRIMKRLGHGGARRSLESVVDAALSGRKSESELAQEDLFDLVLSDADLSVLIRRHGSNRDELRNIYQMLVLSGAGQWIRGGFVPAAALATIPTLDYILSSLRHNAQADPRDLSLVIASDLIEYYQSGRMGPVTRASS